MAERNGEGGGEVCTSGKPSCSSSSWLQIINNRNYLLSKLFRKKTPSFWQEGKNKNFGFRIAFWKIKNGSTKVTMSQEKSKQSKAFAIAI